MPHTVAYPHKENFVQDPRIEYSLTKFLGKMIYYIYFADRTVMVHEIGFEQTYYLMFYRIFIVHMLLMGILVVFCISAWSTQYTKSVFVLVHRMMQAKEFILTDNDFHTFIQSFVTIITTAVILHYRSRLGLHNYSRVQASEKKNVKVRDDHWHQVRTMKVRGIHHNDFRGECFKLLLEKLMEKEGIKGRVERVMVIPDLQPSIEIMNQIESYKNR